MEAFQQEQVTDNSNDCFLNGFVDDKTSQNLPSVCTSNSIMLENGDTNTEGKSDRIVRDSELTAQSNVVFSSSNVTTNNTSTEISVDSLNGNKDLQSSVTSTVDEMLHILLKSDDNIENNKDWCTQPIEFKTNMVNTSMTLIQKEISIHKSLDKLESDQNRDFGELKLNADNTLLRKNFNLEKDCIQPAELKTDMVPENKNLSSYRYECDSWSEDDESSSSSSDTSSDSDFFQRVVESSSGPKNIPEIKTRGELSLDELPPIEELCIEIPKEDMMLIGKIHAIVEKLVVVHAVKDMKPLDIDSVLFLSHNKPLGRVYDVFGPVVEPFYCIRFNTEEEIAEKMIEIGADVFFAPEKNDITTYVFVDELQKEKGSDASWKFNNEPPEECLDFSDDEQEKEAKRKRMNKYRNHQISTSLQSPAKRPSLISFTNTSDSQQYYRSRPTTPLYPSPRSSTYMPTATRFSPFSCSRSFLPPLSPSPSPSIIRAQRHVPFSLHTAHPPPPPPSHSIIGVQNYVPFPIRASHPPPPPSPSVIEVEVLAPFSNSYPYQPPPSPSTSVVAAQRFSPFPNANPSHSHSPSPSDFATQRYIRFSNPPPSLPPTAPRFTNSNSYPPLPPPPSSPPPPPPSSPMFEPLSVVPSSSNSYPPPPPSPVFIPSRLNPFSNQYPPRPPPSPSFTAPTFNPFLSPYSAHTIPPPSLSTSSSNSDVFAKQGLPLFTPQGDLQRQSTSTSNIQPHSVNYSTPSKQCATPIISHQQQNSFSTQIAMQRQSTSTSNMQPHSVNYATPSEQYAAPIISRQQQNSFSTQIAMQRPTLPPHHVFGQVTLMSSLPPPVSMSLPVNPLNESPRPLMQIVRPPTNYTYEPI